MTYRPKNNSKKEKLLAIICASVAIVLYFLSGIVHHFPVLYQVTAIIMGVVSIEIYLKYVGSDYVYEAAEKSLKIHRITGKKSVCVGSLDYEMSRSLLIKSSEYLGNKDKYPKYNFNVNYAKNLSPKEYYVYFFDFNEKVCMAKFEPDEVFAQYVNEKISVYLNSNNDE